MKTESQFVIVIKNGNQQKFNRVIINPYFYLSLKGVW